MWGAGYYNLKFFRGYILHLVYQNVGISSRCAVKVINRSDFHSVRTCFA